MSSHKFITGIFFDDKDLLSAIKAIQERGISIFDVRTPFPVHGLDDVLKLERSRLPKVGFVGGVVGGVLAFLFQTWVFTASWPLNIGGKPFFAVPSFVPVTFEMTVLFAAIALVFAFLIRSGIGPGANSFRFDDRITGDGFIVIIEVNEQNRKEYIEAILEEIGTGEIKYVEPVTKINKA